MLPPPMTMPTWTPSSMTSRISSATCSSTLGEMPYLLSPIRASPESFSKMRLNRVVVGFSGNAPPRPPCKPREANCRVRDGQGRGAGSVRVVGHLPFRQLRSGELARNALQSGERLDLHVGVGRLKVGESPGR